MPSFAHEAPLVLFRECPDFAVQVVRELFGVEVPHDHPVHVVEADLTQLVPAEFRADLVLQVGGEPPAMGIIIEVQRRVWDRKRFVWPVYVATLHAKLCCQTCLLVVTADAAVARWAAQPISSLQPGSPFVPLVLGPEQVPWLDDPAAARAPELAVLSALAHAESPGALDAVETALHAISSLERDRANLYLDLIIGSLPAVMIQAVEQLMQSRNYEYQSDFARRYYGQGREAGREEGREAGREEGREAALRGALGRLVKARLGDVPAGIQAAIDSCSDSERLLDWIEQVGGAADLATIPALFEREHTT